MRRSHWLFCLALGCLSGFWAESTISSSVFLFAQPWSLLVTVPLYALHAILLAWLITRRRNPPFYLIYFAGAVFGLYEAYVTKMLFHHAWDSPQWTYAGVSWFAFPLLVFWYHPLFAFIVPLFLSELLVSGSKRGSQIVPERLRNKLKVNPLNWMIGLGAFMGFYHSLAAKAPLGMIGSLFDGLVIYAVVLTAKKMVTTGNSASELMPNRIAIIACAFWLLVICLFTGLNLRLEALPPLEGHITIIGFYSFFLAIILASIRKKQPTSDPGEFEPPIISMHQFGAALVSWLVVSGFFFVAPPVFGMIAFLVCTAGGFILGPVLPVLCLRAAYRDFFVITS